MGQEEARERVCLPLLQSFYGLKEARHWRKEAGSQGPVRNWLRLKWFHLLIFDKGFESAAGLPSPCNSRNAVVSMFRVSSGKPFRYIPMCST